MTNHGVAIGQSIGLAALYVLTARVGLTFDAIEGFPSLIWLPSGVSLAALLIFGTRLWPGVFVGAFIAALPIALLVAAGNTGEAVGGVWLLRRVRDFSASLGDVKSVVALIVLAALGATVVAATIGVGSLYIGGAIKPGTFLHTWRAWWIGDVVGALIITPVLLVWTHKAKAPPVRLHWAETAAISIAIAVAVAISFFGDLPFIPSMGSRLHEASVLLIVLLWATMRFGPRGAATAAFCVSAAAVFATVLGHGPLVHPGEENGLLSLQTFIAIVAATFLLLGAHVSQLRLAVADARAAQSEAAYANRTKSEFLAVMSHELRTPLNAIGGYAQLLIEGVHGALNPKQKDALERIQRNEKELLGHIEDIFGFVNAEKGRARIKPQPVLVSTAFDAVDLIARPEFSDRQCKLIRTDRESALSVQADPKALTRILASLLSNASKFCGQPPVVTLGADADGDWVRIWVRDNGPGISNEEIQRVFDPFFQADRGLTRRTAGIGLGLTIARDLAKLMGGEILLESGEQGTTATVRLPKAK